MNSEFSNSIKAEALRLGFFACGIAKAEPVDDDTARAYKSWLQRGGHADMHYLENYLDKRLDPRLLMPGVKSIVSVALSYAPSQHIPDGEYQIAAYAYGQDYHDIMKQKLRQLATYIVESEEWKDESGERKEGLRVFCDSAPVLERYWAVRAGIGWIGRNHQLIIPHAGSMFFLGELFLDMELAYDQPQPNHCGTCHRCIDACPTHALAPNTVESGERKDEGGERKTTSALSAPDSQLKGELCLSYHTIENRADELPPDIIPHLGNTIYGCDRCLQVCPWNRFAPPTTEPQLQPRPELLQMTKEQWEHLTVEQYQQLFKGSAVKRAKYSGLTRNIRAAQTAKNEEQDSPQ